MKIIYFKLRAVVVTWLMRLLPRNPPIVYKGINSALTLCEQVAVLGYNKVLLVTDHFLDSSGLLDGIKATLQKTGVEFLVYDGVLPDPAFDQVQAGEARNGVGTGVDADVCVRTQLLAEAGAEDRRRLRQCEHRPRLTVLPAPAELAEPPVEPPGRLVRAGGPEVDEAADAEAEPLRLRDPGHEETR